MWQSIEDKESLNLFLIQVLREKTPDPFIPREFLIQNLRHPSLRAKKYDEQRNIWQARVNGGWRFYFPIEGDTYIIHSIRPHPQ